jgi:drug/metabolite transporter (DMT)-like permease
MDLLWIPISVLGAFLQAVRTAGQKDLNARLSIMGTTYVRSLFGLPVMLLFLWVVIAGTDQPVPAIHGTFLLYSLGTAIAQVAGTIFLIRLFSLRNFAVGNTLIKVDTMMTAIIGSLLFSEALSGIGWLAVIVTLGGVLLLTAARAGPRALGLTASGTTWKPTLIGFASALSFTFSYLFLREASLSLGSGDFLMRSACTVVTVTSIQMVSLSLWLFWREPDSLRDMLRDWRLSTFIGVTSALGSLCWFSAMTLENASYVRSVGQVEAIFSLLISHFYFREEFNKAEIAGIAVIVAGVLLFLL